ncbi:Pkinase-domain-containing protein [Ramaria rubella]|nr:Pkinase-domain-containing protein [Ramaria rubella]
MDAFKNLIRHGKNHHQVGKQHHHASQDPHPSQQPFSTQPAVQRHHDLSSPPYTKEAEIIVQEEREAKSKMPHYKGLERFKIIDKMGDGAFSNVYKAIDLPTGERVAIKVVRKFELNSSQDGNKHLNEKFKKKPRVTERANILKEVQIMRQINHESIVKLKSFSESDEYYFLVLELLEGGELFHQIVKLTYFSENLSRHIIVQVANGIRFLHEECGVVHRDIKPENLLFDRIPIEPSKTPISRPYDEEKEDEGVFKPGVGGGGIGRVKIADFGLSKVVWNEETMTPCGTVGYTAPEIVKDERYSKSVDMWALGCVLYTLLCGFPPFYDESINVLTEKVARGYYTFLSPWWDDISSAAKDLITHLLCVDPSQRYTIDEFLAHPWINEMPATPSTPSSLAVPSTYMPLDSPLLHAVRGGGGREGRSPGLATLKEAFDITYAVHRMEEEGARRRAYNGPGGAGIRGFLHGLNEADENVEDIDGVAEVRAKHGAEAGRVLEAEQRRARGKEPPQGQQQQYQYEREGADRQVARALYDGRAGTRDQPLRSKRGVGTGNTTGFDLDLDGATLLGRRHRRGVSAEPSPLRQPVSAIPRGALSPMRDIEE